MLESVSSQTKDYQHNSLSIDRLIGWLYIYIYIYINKQRLQQHNMIVVSIINILYQEQHIISEVIIYTN